MTNPKITFKLNKEKDKENLRFFINYKSRSGTDSYEALVFDYPELKNLRDLPKEKQEKIINKFVEDKYKELSEELQLNLKEAIRIWKTIESYFFQEVQKLFNHSWSRKEFTVYLTIFDRFRYDLENGFFFVPRNTKRRSITKVAMHELLHFMFFEYWKKHFEGRLSEDKLWDLSEIFDVIILNKEPWIKFAGQKSQSYPAHEQKYKELNELFNKSKDLKEFLEKAVKLL
ncbi:hypothetical protein HY837_03085 [archaeon]|nr:hypothetical protein [archaeon]